MVKDNEELLLKSLCHIQVIKNLFSSDYETFMKDYDSLDGIMFHLIQIGEIAGKFSNDFCQKHNDIDFTNIKGLRNVVVHDYTGVVYNELFDIIKDDIPNLEKDYKNILFKDFNLSNEFISKYIKYFIDNRKFLKNEDI